MDLYHFTIKTANGREFFHLASEEDNFRVSTLSAPAHNAIDWDTFHAVKAFMYAFNVAVDTYNLTPVVTVNDSLRAFDIPHLWGSTPPRHQFTHSMRSVFHEGGVFLQDDFLPFIKTLLERDYPERTAALRGCVIRAHKMVCNKYLLHPDLTIVL